LRSSRYPAAWRSRKEANACSAQSSSLEGGDERLLGDLDAADVLHLLLALLLLLEQLALAGDVAAVALGQHVLALGLHRLAGDDLARRWRPGWARRTSGAGSARELLAHARP
jgi:hypothetical protein